MSGKVTALMLIGVMVGAASTAFGGLRGDYRFVMTKSMDDAPAFSGRDSRYLHRLYAGVVINTAR